MLRDKGEEAVKRERRKNTARSRPQLRAQRFSHVTLVEALVVSGSMRISEAKGFPDARVARLTPFPDPAVMQGKRGEVVEHARMIIQ